MASGYLFSICRKLIGGSATAVDHKHSEYRQRLSATKSHPFSLMVYFLFFDIQNAFLTLKNVEYSSEKYVLIAFKEAVVCV